MPRSRPSESRSRPPTSGRSTEGLRLGPLPVLRSPRPGLVRVLLAMAVTMLALTDLAHARAPARPAPVLYTRSSSPLPESDIHRDARWDVDLVIRDDGTVSGRGGRHLATLTPADLRVLRRQIRRTRLVLESQRLTCDALPIRSTRIATQAGELSWSSPCGTDPHVSVLELEALARNLVKARCSPPIPHPELEP